MKHPYSGLAPHHFWNRSLSDIPYADINFLPLPKFVLHGSRKIATAGSCFAQNIARYLREHQGHFYDAEPKHPLMGDDYATRNGYGVFSARFGNIYTTRQLWELLSQAFGRSQVIFDFHEEKGLVYDLLRPSVQQDGFSCREEAAADRHYHLARVKEMFLSCDVFVFTLGLTESWMHALNGYTYPACPGTARGIYDPNVHRFKNFTFEECYSDMDKVIRFLTEVNPACKLVVTVSPVALAATYEQNNVLVSTTYSKSVLRAVCGEIERQYAHVQYFPSYEIIASACSFGQYLTQDLRGANERGIRHVMHYFGKAFYPDGFEKQEVKTASSGRPDDSIALAKQLIEAECDEMFNNPESKRA